MFENGQIVVFDGKCRRFRVLPKLLNRTVPQIIDQFRRKTCQKKRKDVSNQLV